MSAKLLEFKRNVDAITYDDVLANRFNDLSHRFERAGYNGEQDLVCTFTVDAKVWKSWQKAGMLGHIYNADLSNFLSRKGILKHYAVPSVDDRARASKGRKSITVRFGGF